MPLQTDPRLPPETTLRRIDTRAGLFLERLAGGDRPLLRHAAALVSRAVGQGHVCLPLALIAADPLLRQEQEPPDAEGLRQALLSCPVVGRPGERTPLILDHHDRLYLYRYYRHEERIAEALLARGRHLPDLKKINTGAARSLLRSLFPAAGTGPDHQQTAAALTLLKPLVVISGGPGTGKTHTVARILALLRGLRGDCLRIGLAAPTGKAAARLQESIRAASRKIDTALAADIPDQAVTLHRLLGYRPDSGTFRHDRTNPLHLDVLILDEASMIDVVLMASLLEALPPRCRLILLGDRHQLASVEAGCLFSDLCGRDTPAWSTPVREALADLTGHCPAAGTEHGPMADCVVLLRTSYRFREDSGIGNLARAVNSGRIGAVQEVLAEPWEDLSSPGIDARQQDLEQSILTGFGPLFHADSAAAALERLDSFRLLCALRHGSQGVSGLNDLAERVLCRAGLITGSPAWYAGRPIMILRNRYSQQLFNGDTGILWPDRQGRLQAWFRRPDGSLRPVALSRLPEHETAWAITIHKSQGSEFDTVLLVLPDSDVRVLSRELVYTAITRARRGLRLYADPEILARAVRRRAVRHSGLRSRLWPEEEHRPHGFSLPD